MADVAGKPVMGSRERDKYCFKKQLFAMIKKHCSSSH